MSRSSCCKGANRRSSAASALLQSFKEARIDETAFTEIDKTSDPHTDFELALALGDSDQGELLAEFAKRHSGDAYFDAAIMGSLSRKNSSEFLIAIIKDEKLSDIWLRRIPGMASSTSMTTPRASGTWLSTTSQRAASVSWRGTPQRGCAVVTSRAGRPAD